MEILFDGDRESGWHRQWMTRTPRTYEWWYLDVISDDREWSLVAIFLLGNPFSPYYRRCFQGCEPNPLQYNAVYFSLHRVGHLNFYLLAQYPVDRIQIADGVRFSAQFGPNSWNSRSSRRETIVINELNANNRHLNATISLSSSIEPCHSAGTKGSDKDHRWLPEIPSGIAEVNVRISSPSVTSELEVLRFHGNGYHDHNWGVLPFDSEILNWTWARVDFGGGTAAIIYWIMDRAHSPTTTLLYYEAGRMVIDDRVAKVEAAKWRLTKFGTFFPAAFTVRSGETAITVRADEKLEDVPFYIRYRHSAALRRNGTVRAGVGIGEFLKPTLMSTAVASWGMSRRIYEPDTGS